MDILDIAVDFLFNVIVALVWLTGGIGVLGFLLYVVSVIREFTQNEGTATGWRVMGRYSATTMEYTGHHFDDDGFIVDGPGPNTHGDTRFMFRIVGWIFYIWIFVKSVKYLEYNEADGFGDGYYVFLHEILLEVKLTKAETRESVGGGAIAPDIDALFRAKVVNVRLFQFVAPKDAIGQTIKVMETIFRNLARTHTVDELLNMDADAIWTLVYATGSSSRREIDDKRQSWGIEVVPRSLSIRSVGFSAAYQSALEARGVNLLNAEGEVARLSVPKKMFADWVAERVTGDTDAEKAASRTAILASDEAKHKEKYFEEVWKIVLAGPGYRINEYKVEGGDLASAIAIADAFGLGRRGGRGAPPSPPTTT